MPKKLTNLCTCSHYAVNHVDNIAGANRGYCRLCDCAYFVPVESSKSYRIITMAGAFEVTADHLDIDQEVAKFYRDGELVCVSPMRDKYGAMVIMASEDFEAAKAKVAQPQSSQSDKFPFPIKYYPICKAAVCNIRGRHIHVTDQGVNQILEIPQYG